MTKADHISALLRVLECSEVSLIANTSNPQTELLQQLKTNIPSKLFFRSGCQLRDAYDNGPVEHMNYLSFTLDCPLKELHVAMILSSFLGMTRVFPVQDELNRKWIRIGFPPTYTEEPWPTHKSVPLASIVTKLPKSNAREVVLECFPRWTADEIEELNARFDSGADAGAEESDQRRENDRNTFNFLTGGSGGDFDDWSQSGADQRDLQDSLGL